MELNDILLKLIEGNSTSAVCASLLIRGYGEINTTSLNSFTELWKVIIEVDEIFATKFKCQRCQAPGSALLPSSNTLNSPMKLLEPTFPMSFQSIMLAFQLISLQHWYLI